MDCRVCRDGCRPQNEEEESPERNEESRIMFFAHSRERVKVLLISQDKMVKMEPFLTKFGFVERKLMISCRLHTKSVAYTVLERR